MRHGSFSLSKSMGAAVAMLRLAEKYGVEVFDLRIADYVAVTAEHDGWDQVTFGDALNMATGIGDSQDLDNFVEEDEGERFFSFVEAPGTGAKLRACFSAGNYEWGPGEVARYSSMDTFVLSVAMDSYVKSVEGPEAGIWDLLLEEVYEPIGIRHAPVMRVRELDGSAGVPIFAYGLYPTVEDVARIAMLLQEGGLHDGQQLLHAEMLAQALYQTEVTGFPTAEQNDYGEGRYNMSFWAMPYQTDQGDVVQVPYMSGFGGNRAILAPNGVTAFRFADAHVYGFESMVGVMENLLPFSVAGQE
jgi:CubicO group peptidase (beta-lactamase class C family)